MDEQPDPNKGENRKWLFTNNLFKNRNGYLQISLWNRKWSVLRVSVGCSSLRHACRRRVRTVWCGIPLSGVWWLDRGWRSRDWRRRCFFGRREDSSISREGSAAWCRSSVLVVPEHWEWSLALCNTLHRSWWRIRNSWVPRDPEIGFSSFTRRTPRGE